MKVLDGYRIQKTLLSAPPRGSAGVWAVLSVIFLTVMQLIYQQDLFNLGSWLSATPHQVFAEGQLWRAWTTAWVHADVEHFLSNLGFFAGLAFLLRGYFGGWVFPGLSLFFGGIINLLALATYPEDQGLVGASGIVYFMAAFWLAVYLGIDRSVRLLQRGANALAFGLVLLAPQGFEPRVSYRTHLIGLGVGLLVGWIYFVLNRQVIRKSEVLVPIEDPEAPALTETLPNQYEDYAKVGE